MNTIMQLILPLIIFFGGVIPLNNSQKSINQQKKSAHFSLDNKYSKNKIITKQTKSKIQQVSKLKDKNKKENNFTTITVIVPEDYLSYQKEMTKYVQIGAENPLLTAKFIKKKVNIPYTKDIIRASAEAAAKQTNLGEMIKLEYFDIKNRTAYVVLNIDIDGWAGVSVTQAIVRPIIKRTLLQFTDEVKRVVFGYVPEEIVIPENYKLYRKEFARYVQTGGENPLLTMKFKKKIVDVIYSSNSKNYIIKATAEAALKEIEPERTIDYFKIKDKTVYILLDIDVDGYACVSVDRAAIHPIIEKTLLQFTDEVKKVVFDYAPEDK